MKKTLARYLIATIGLAFVALGTALSVKSDLGTAPVSAPPYVMNLWGGLTVGGYTACLHGIFIILQIILLRSRFKLSYLMQIPAALIFGFMIDFFIWTLGWFDVSEYAPRLLLSIAGLASTALGVSIEVRAGAWMLAGEMMVSAISEVSGIKFRNVKVFFDTGLVLIAAGISLAVFGNPLGNGDSVIIREGTLILAVCTGLLMKVIDPAVDKAMLKLKL